MVVGEARAEPRKAGVEGGSERRDVRRIEGGLRLREGAGGREEGEAKTADEGREDRRMRRR